MNKILIYGGLGNQMFQYALYLSMKAAGENVRLSFSNFFYQNYHNGFNLAEAFSLKLSFPDNFYCFLLLKNRILYKNKLARAVLRRVIPAYKNRYYRHYREQKEFEYDQRLFDQRSSLLTGTWQVESYFKYHRDTLLKAFEFKVSEDIENRALIKKITSVNAISIHVRRGDYLSESYRESHEVIKSSCYYYNAINYLNQRISDPHYFVFSDDFDWVKEHLQLANCIYIEHNAGKKSYMDMYLMSLCKHNIISNSTFSWWGAWLNRNEDKIVIMPEKWLNNDSAKGIFPEKWIKMKV